MRGFLDYARNDIKQLANFVGECFKYLALIRSF